MYVKLGLCHLSDQGQQKVIKSSPDCQRRLSIFFAMFRPFGEWKIPKQENKDTGSESSKLQKESLSRGETEGCGSGALR